MAQEVQALMATRLALDTLPATKALSGLKQSVSVVTEAWKAQADAQKNAGDQIGAQKTKIEGLSNAIGRQKEYIAKLSDNQQHYLDVAKNFKENQSQVADEIKQVKSAMQAEADQSGKNSDQYRELNNRLKELKATQRDIKNNGSRLMTVTRQIENARAKLESMNAQAKQANETLKSMSPSGLSRIRSAAGRAVNALASVQHTTERAKSTFAGTTAGVMAGNAISGAWQGAKMAIGAAVGAGVQFDKQQQVMQASWETLMGSASKATNMRNSIIDMSNALGQPVELTDELSQQFYHVFDNQPETEKLTRSFLTMGDAIGLSSDRLQQVGMDFTHMLSSSKLQLGDLNQITDAFPMFGNALLEYEKRLQNNGQLTMADLRKQISAGKIQSKDAEAVMNQLGQKYKKASDNLMNTLPGMARQVKAKLSQLSGDVMHPILNYESPVYKQVSEWVKDPRTDAEFKNLGKKVNNGIQNVMQAFGATNTNNNIAGGLDRAVEKIGQVITQVTSQIASHAQTIKASFGLFTSIASLLKGVFVNAVKVAIGAMSSLIGLFTRSNSKSQTTAQQLTTVSNAIKKLTANKAEMKALGTVVASLYGLFKFSQLITGLASLNRTLKLTTGAMKLLNFAFNSNPIVKWINVIVLAGTAIVELYKHCKPFREVVNWIGSTVLSVLRGLLNVVRSVVGGITSAWNTARNTTKSFVNAFKNTLGAAINFVKNGWKTLPLMMLSPVLGALASLYKNNPKFRAWANDLAKKTMSGLNSLGTKFKTFFTKTLPNSITSARDAISDAAKQLIKWLFSPVQDALNGFESVYNKVAGKMHLPTLKAILPGYASGSQSATAGGEVAIVNDAQSSHWREMLKFRDGTLVPFPNRRNVKTFIPAGAQVIDGETAHNIAQNHGLKHYASGSSSENSSGSDEFSSLVFGMRSYGDGTRSVVMREFLTKLDSVFRTNMNKFRKAIQNANNELKTSIANAVAKMQQTIASARDNYNEKASNAKQSRDEKLQRAQESKQQKDQNADQSYAQKVTDANNSKNEKIANATQTKSDQDADAKQSYDDKTQSANQTWQEAQTKYKDDPDKLNKARQTWQNKLAKAQSALDKANSKHQRKFDETVSKANTAADTALNNAQQSHDQSLQASSQSYNNSVNSANNTFNSTMLRAKKALDSSVTKARNTEQQAVSRAQNKRDNAVNIANQNIASLNRWYADNKNQLSSGMAEFAHGGIARTPSIFGEAGAEMAIPLNDASSGRAWQLLQQVVDFYAGANPAQNVLSNSQASDSQAVRVLSDKFDAMIELLQQLVTGQGKQIQATKSVQGYDADKAFSDFSTNFRTAQSGNLTY